MKIKHSLSISIKPQTTVFFIVSVICIAVRCIQMFKYIDHETGFITGGEFLNGFLYGLIFVSFLYFTLTSYLSKQSKKIDVHSIKNPLTAAFTLIFAVSLVFDWINSISLSVDALEVTPAYGGMRALMSSGCLPVTLQSFFALFSAVYFFIVGFDYLKGRNKAAKHRLLALFPVGWACMRLVYRFLRKISFVEISDLFLELVMLAFMILMLMAFAQVNSGVYSDGFAWRITGFGLSAGLIAICISVARLIFSVVKGSDAVNADYAFNFVDFAFSLFIIGLAIDIKAKLNKTVKKEAIVTEENNTAE